MTIENESQEHAGVSDESPRPAPLHHPWRMYTSTAMWAEYRYRLINAKDQEIAKSNSREVMEFIVRAVSAYKGRP